MCVVPPPLATLYFISAASCDYLTASAVRCTAHSQVRLYLTSGSRNITGADKRFGIPDPLQTRSAMCQASQVYMPALLGPTQRVACLSAGKNWRVVASSSPEVVVGRKMDNLRNRDALINKPGCKDHECDPTRNVVLVAVDEPNILPETTWSLSILHKSLQDIGANADLVIIATPQSKPSLVSFVKGREVRDRRAPSDRSCFGVAWKYNSGAQGQACSPYGR